MIRWLVHALTTLSLAIFAAPANSAEITHEALENGVGVIAIVGEITSADLQRFRQVTLRYKRALVALDSDGGQLLPAIEIGKLIQIAGYDTVVPDDSICASSCALIWLAGQSRFMSSEGHVGFHASYRNNKGTLEESGVANALIGNYLTLLNLPRRAIIFATTAAPDKILWLTTANKSVAGIDFQPFGEAAPVASATGAPVTVAPPPIQTVRQLPSNKLPAYLPSSLSSTGENWVQFASDGYYDASSVRTVENSQGQNTGREFWILIDYKNDEQKNKVFGLAKVFISCSQETQAFYEWVTYDADGKSKREAISRLAVPITPGSSGKRLLLQVCR